MKTAISGRKEIHEELTEGLQIHLANLYGLMIKNQSFHWNVQGPEFFSLHQLFEDFYNELFREIDVTAERIRALGAQVEGSLQAFYEGSMLADRGMPRDADGMLEEMITCAVVVREYTQELLKLSGLAADEVSSDLLIQQMKLLEKRIWMCRSSLTRVASQRLVEDESVSRSMHPEGGGSESRPSQH